MSVAWRVLKVEAADEMRLSAQRERDYVKDGVFGGNRYNGTQVTEEYYGPVAPFFHLAGPFPLHSTEAIAAVIENRNKVVREKDAEIARLRELARRYGVARDKLKARVEDLEARPFYVWTVYRTERDAEITQLKEALNVAKSKQGETARRNQKMSEEIGELQRSLIAEKLKATARADTYLYGEQTYRGALASFDAKVTSFNLFNARLTRVENETATKASVVALENRVGVLEAARATASPVWRDRWAALTELLPHLKKMTK